jgi:threonyl-tRNA synthetase
MVRPPRRTTFMSDQADEKNAAEDPAAGSGPSHAEGKPMSDLERVRHSCAHVLATAILRLWPEAQFAAGPPVENGFYYDVELPHRISPDDFDRIEAEMKIETKANHVFERVPVTRAEAVALAERGALAALGDRPGTPSKYKLDIVQNIPEGAAITLFRNGDFTDLCAGPHVARTGNIGAFKLTHVASAYYKGDEKNPQLQRIYGTAFKNRTQMDAYFAILEEAKKRDHRKLGKELQLYTIDEDVGPGLPLWLPRGTAIIEELEKLAKETEFAAGYERVRTPHIARENIYLTSGHLPYYADSMFPPMLLEDAVTDPKTGTNTGERYYLKAMNCPHHHKLFAAVPHSYRDLPLRFAEYGTCYRYEQSGELFGLMRVRSMQMNDAHIYCTEAQFEAEFNAVNEMYLKYFNIFGVDKYRMRFSTHDPAKLGQKFVDDPVLWKKTEDMVRNVLKNSGVDYIEVPNEAAFYGPKIDVQVWSSIGREFTLATNQVDFAVPARFGLVYKTRENTEATPLCIHRAPLGTHERFIGFLIEHYAGNFPFWLAPEQVRILPLLTGADDEHPLLEYAKSIQHELRAEGIRATLDLTHDKINGKVLRAEEMKVHTMLVVGRRDLESGNVSVRVHGKGNVGAKPHREVMTELLAAAKDRRR